MSRTLTDARQIALRRFLEQIGNRTHHDGTADAKPAGQSELDNLLDSLDLELTPPLRMDASSPADLTLSIGPAIVTNTENDRNRSIPHVGNLLPNDFTAGTITLPASSGGNIVITPGNDTILTVTANNYIKILIYMDANGDLNALAGVENVVEADATVLPTPRNTLPLGYLSVFNNAGTIENLEQAKIFQFGLGAGGSGAGDASSIEETIKNRLLDSPFEAVTPNIFERNEDDLVDGSSTGTFSLVTNNFAFANAAETMVSVQMLDADFLASGNSLQQIELMAFWNLDTIDTAATYEVSRNGGIEWQTVTMDRIGDTELYRGFHTFTQEAANQIIDSQAVQDDTEELNITTQLEIGSAQTIANTTELREIDLNFAINDSGSLAGKIFVSLYTDDGGGLPDELITETSAIEISGLSVGTNTINISDSVVTAGTYHVVVRTDQEYKNNFAAGVDSISLDSNSAGSSGTINGGAWGAGTFDLVYEARGIEYDLRVRITSSVGDVNLEGTGIFYDGALGGIATGIVNRETFKFKAVADNLDQFTLTKFVPNPELLKVYYVEAGQVLIYPSFDINGQSLQFATNQFNNGGAEADVTLIFDQTTGGAFDNSDLNALLLTANHLGSPDASIDRSANGLGIFLRRPDGTLREITIDDNDDIVIYSV